MKFRFIVNVSDEEYFEYNKFWMLRSPYGKKQIIKNRITVSVVFGLCILFLLFSGGFSMDSLISIIPLVILLGVFHVFLPRFLTSSIKGQMKALKKSGKPGYSPNSVIEFYDDGFVETTEDNKTEQKYTSIERISIVDNKMLYIHVNNIMAYMLPLRSFESEEQYDEFLELMKAKCSNIDIY